jgi:superfamily II DNA or RNA helicase
MDKDKKIIMELYEHQKRFDSKNPNNALLAWEVGTGKTVAACTWMNRRANLHFLVSCPKGIVEKWKRDLEVWGVMNADIVSRDEIKKTNLEKYDGLVLDEAQDYSSPLFDKSRSQRAEVVYNYRKAHKNAHILMLTANPVRSTPWNMHTLACYMGIFYPVKEFRNDFFYMSDKFGRMHYEKRSGWQKMIRPYVESIADIVLMSDCTDVPAQHHQVITIPWTKKQEEELKVQQQEEPSMEWHARHRAEQGDAKWDKVKELIDGYHKVIVVCYYKAQIKDYVDRIGDEREVYVLTGETKDQDAVIEGAKASKNCVFFIQASMGAGFDAGEFSVIIFASQSFRYVDKVQMCGRVKRINNLHENTFIYLLAGKTDMAVYKTIESGKDFDPINYNEK